MGDVVVSLVIATMIFGFVFATFIVSLLLSIFYIEHHDKATHKPKGPKGPKHHHIFGGHIGHRA